MLNLELVQSPEMLHWNIRQWKIFAQFSSSWILYICYLRMHVLLCFRRSSGCLMNSPCNFSFKFFFLILYETCIATFYIWSWAIWRNNFQVVLQPFSTAQILIDENFLNFRKYDHVYNFLTLIWYFLCFIWITISWHILLVIRLL